jgi:meiotically up-regulated gene 157 (Mug157) protein
MKLLFDNLIQSWEPQKLFIFEEMGFEQDSFRSPVETAEPVENKAQKTLTYNPEQSREIRQQIYEKEQQEQHEFESNKNRISETLIKEALEDDISPSGSFRSTKAYRMRVAFNMLRPRAASKY